MTAPERLSIWVIYDHPFDYPDSYVARRWEIDTQVMLATTEVLFDDRLGPLQAQMIERGLTKLWRWPHDDLRIVETWL